MNLQITNIENDVLLSNTKTLVKEERRIQVQVLLHLQEIERRKLFLELGYGSLFDFVTKELGYSESAGYRRIQAMRLMKSVPTVGQKISEGTLTLTTAAQVQTFLKSDAKLNGPTSTVSASQLVNIFENKSSREVEKHLLSLKPTESFTIEKVRQITDTHTEIRLVIPDELKQTLDQLRLIFSHVNPNMSYQELIAYLAATAIKKHSVKKCSDSLPVKEVVSPSLNNPAKRSRYISSEVKSAVWSKFKGCCSFKNSVTGKICGSKFQVQFDHINPFAMGGDNEVENLRLLCAQHNRLESVKVFGKFNG